MARIKKPYHKLPGRGSFLLSYTRLFLAEDHLLQVVSTGFTETYLRFYFRDIQTIIVRKTSMGKIFNAVLIGLMVIFGSLFFAPNGEIGGTVALIVLGVPLVCNLLLGPTCVTYLQTAVQRRKVSSMGRLWLARRALKTMLPFIESAQAPRSEETSQDHPHPASGGPVGETSVAPPPSGTSQPEPTAPPSSLPSS